MALQFLSVYFEYHEAIKQMFQLFGVWSRLDRAKENLCEAAHMRISIQRQDLLVRVQQLAGICDVDCSFLFVTRQHPNLQAGFPQRSNSFRNAILQPILNAGRSCRRQHTNVTNSLTDR